MPNSRVLIRNRFRSVPAAGVASGLKERKICIPFDLVEKITWHGSNNTPRAKMTLNAAGPYGSVFTFVPDLTEGRGRAREMVQELNSKLAH